MNTKIVGKCFAVTEMCNNLKVSPYKEINYKGKNVNFTVANLANTILTT